MAQRPSTTTIAAVNQASGQKLLPIVSSRAQSTAARTQVTADQMRTPADAARAVNDLQQRIAASTAGSRSNPRNAGCVYVRNVTFVSGTAILLRHNLGRDPIGYSVIDTYPGAAAAILLRRTTLPMGLTLAQALNVIPSASGMGTVEIF